MPAPLLLTGSIRSKTRLTQWAHFGILAALGGLLFLESRFLLRTSGGTSSSTASRAMQSHLDDISSGINAYMQGHDAASLERIKAEGKEASRLMEEFKTQLQDMGKEGAAEQLEQDHEEVRQATIDLLAADHDVVKNHLALSASNDALSAVLDQMQMSIRSNSLNASSRTRAVRIARSEAGSDSKNEARFKRAIKTFEDLSRTRRAALWSEQARGHFDTGMALQSALQAADKKKQAALDRFAEKKKALQNSLRGSPLGLQDKSGILFVTLNAALLFVAIVLVWRVSRRIDKEVARPMQEILRCVEAAAAGDTSRVPEHWAADEVGQLAQAAGRLISVLARSENLIYHLAALVESSGDAIISQTLDGKILSWNKGAQRIYGYSAEEVKGQSIDLLSPQDSGQQMMQCLKQIRSGEKLQPFEAMHQARNGRDVPVLVRVAAIHDSTRKIIGASFVAQDMTGSNLLPSKTHKSKAA